MIDYDILLYNMSYHIDIPKGIQKMVIREAYDTVKDIGLECNGTIFGGFVRDEFIREYYTDQYYKSISCKITRKNKFWEKLFSHTTRGRYILPTDMDISFKNIEECNNFINKLKTIKHFENVKICDEYYFPEYNTYAIESVKKIKIDLSIGNVPFYNDGVVVVINIDVLIEKSSNNMEPPFGKLDMLCNGFILKKDRCKRLSKNTGTIIDTYYDYVRAIKTVEILKDMVNFRTHICLSVHMDSVNFYTLNLDIMERIERMSERQFKWSFINMPFTIEVCKNVIENFDCCICCKNFRRNDRISYTSIKNDGVIVNSSAKMHLYCCMKYLKTQRQEAEKHFENDRFIFKCPVRNNIDFAKCHLIIDKIGMMSKIYKNDMV